MQIKKFIAPTLKEATIKMKDELSGEAVILGTRVIEGNAGIGIARMFEITAGYEEETFEQPQLAVENNPKPDQNYLNELQNVALKFQKKQANPVPAAEPAQQAYKSVVEFDNEMKEVVEGLFDKDVQKSVINEVVNQLKKYSKFLHSSNLDNYVLSALSSMIPTANLELKKTGQPRVISFVGPTGVGKTTCIAKLAVIAKILHNLDVGLISIDTYRLGAIDQLKIFSEISKTDLLVAYEPEEMQKHLQAFRKKDLIFIDTAGRSPKNTEQLQKTMQFLQAVKPNETFLVLNTTSTTRNMVDAAEKFKLLNYSSFIFTKIDEAVTFGNIINVINKFNLPVAYLSNGQTIPDDIISADPEFIANMIYTGNYLNVRAS